jgi:hypothetical protein
MVEKVQAKQVGSKYNLLGKGLSEAGWARIQPFRKRFKRSRLGQKLQPMGVKGSSDAGWAKITTLT